MSRRESFSLEDTEILDMVDFRSTTIGRADNRDDIKTEGIVNVMVFDVMIDGQTKILQLFVIYG